MLHNDDTLPDSFWAVQDAPKGPPAITRKGRKRGDIPYIEDVLKLGPGQYRRIKCEIRESDADPLNDPTGVIKACTRIMQTICNNKLNGRIPFETNCQSDHKNKCVLVYRPK